MGDTVFTVFGVCLLIAGVLAFVWTWKQYQQGRSARRPANGPRQSDLIIMSALGGVAALAIGGSYLLPTSGVQSAIGDVGFVAAVLGVLFTMRIARAMTGTK